MAIDFSGGQQLQVAHCSDIEPSAAITLLAWVRPRDAGGPYPAVLIKHRIPLLPPYYSYCLRLNRNTHCWEMRLSSSSSGTVTAGGEGGSVAYNQWQMVAGTWDGQTARLWKNAQPSGAAPAFAGPILHWDTPLFLGGTTYWSPNPILEGTVGPLAIWDRPLSAQELASLFAGCLRPTAVGAGLRWCVPMDSPKSGAAANGDLGLADVSGRHHPAVVLTPPTWADDPPLHWTPQQAIVAANNVHGGYRLYRGGPTRNDIDFQSPVALLDPHPTQADLAGLGHAAGSDTWYALRAVSPSGKEESNRDVVALLSLDAASAQKPPAPPPPTHLAAAAAAGGRVRLSWRYDPPAGSVAAAHFRVYAADGAGGIDFDTPLDTVACTGPADYEWTSEPLADGVRRRFAVRAASADGGEDANTDSVSATPDAQAPAALAAVLAEGT